MARGWTAGPPPGPGAGPACPAGAPSFSLPPPRRAGSSAALALGNPRELAQTRHPGAELGQPRRNGESLVR